MPEPARFRPWLWVAGLLTAATATGLWLGGELSLTSQAMLYVLVVAFCATRVPWIPAAVCAVAAVTALNFFFVPPRFTFEVESSEHLVALAAMLAVALAISRLTTSLRHESAQARLNEDRARQLQALAVGLAGADSPEAVRKLGQTALDEAFAGPCLLWLGRSRQPRGPSLEFPPELAGHDLDGLQACMRERAALGPGTGRWPGLNAWYLPVGTAGQASGAASVRPADAADHAGREHAQAIATLVGETADRLHLAQSAAQARAEADRQQLQAAFLAAVSHDLRTPLAAIVAATSSLRIQADRMAAADRERMLDIVEGEARYLSRLTENTLQLVRLHGSSEMPARAWESMEEIVGSVLARMRQRDLARRIRSHVQPGLPLIHADAVLLAQLVANLLDNALAYSDGAVDLDVRRSGPGLALHVRDRGPGLPAARQHRLFEPQPKGDQEGGGGAGLGLALCQAIARAHGGRLEGRNRQGGGASFSLRLPVDPAQPEVPA